LFIGTPLSKDESAFYRTLASEKYAKLFAVLYDVVYSKEDPDMAADNLSRYDIDKTLLNDLDKAKYLLTLLDIQNKTGQDMNDIELKNLIETYKDSNNDWEKIKEKYFTILKDNSAV